MLFDFYVISGTTFKVALCYLIDSSWQAARNHLLIVYFYGACFPQAAGKALA